ncbi:VanZ family protein [Desulfosediminicola sp.]|uniref:VanZ family protein n=1 Tax=Desulfosediminicola sp. TaxID=2886825 RepID=UPI003AF228E2
MNIKTTKRTQHYRHISIIAAILVLFLLSIPGQWISALQLYIHPLWPWPSSGLASSEIPIDKVVHASLFLVCGALFVRGWHVLQQHWYLIFLLLLLYAVLTEVIQIFVPGRSASIGDLIADVVGIGVGVGFAVVYLRKRRF